MIIQNLAELYLISIIISFCRLATLNSSFISRFVSRRSHSINRKIARALHTRAAAAVDVPTSIVHTSHQWVLWDWVIIVHDSQSLPANYFHLVRMYQLSIWLGFCGFRSKFFLRNSRFAGWWNSSRLRLFEAYISQITLKRKLLWFRESILWKNFCFQFGYSYLK